MAEERDFELLDDYLANRMSAAERSAFEQRLEGDPSLRNEYELQKHVVEAIRQSRVAELKSMLNKVPVPGHGNATGSKFGYAAAMAVIAAAAMWYFTQENEVAPAPAIVETSTVDPQPVPESSPVEVEPEATSTTPAEPRPAPRQSAQVQADKNQTSAGTEHSRPSLAQKPVPPAGPAPRPKHTAPRVVTVSDGQHTFHYQYRDGNLYLFGPFDSTAYAVKDVAFGQTTAPVLVYSDRYYMLTDRDGELHPLEPVTNPADLEKISAALQDH